MFTDWKSKMRNDVLRASFCSFVYMGDDNDGVWLVCLGAILTKGSLSVSFVDIPSNYVQLNCVSSFWIRVLPLFIFIVVIVCLTVN